MTAAVARSQQVSTRQTAAGRTGTRSATSRSVSAGAKMVRPHLKVLDQQAIRRRARRRNLAMTLFVVVIVGFFAAALAQAQLVANQHELDQLRIQIAEAEANRARLERQVEESSAPSAIIQRASEIGMVRANEPIYLAATSAAPLITPISTIGSASAATEALGGAEVRVAAAVAGETDEVAGAEAGAETQVAAPPTGSFMATVAGVRAVAVGVGTG
jgi:cell division protein FtsL